MNLLFLAIASQLTAFSAMASHSFCLGYAPC
jgi:hypothetical protein